MPIPGAEPTQATNLPVVKTNAIRSDADFPILLQGVLALGFLGLLILFAINLVKKSSIKRIIQLAGATIILFLLLILLLPESMPAASDTPIEDLAGIQAPPGYIYKIAPIGNPPANLFWFVTASLLLGAILLGAWLLYQTFRRSRMENPFVSEASAALQAIEEGCDLRSVIIHCYLQMSRIVKEKQGIEREDSVTAREFENLLEARGIPAIPIHQLTRLFEKVRYGSKTPDAQDELAAKECLSAIRSSCQPVAQRSK